MNGRIILPFIILLFDQKARRDTNGLALADNA
jgi:hypothetical protein